MIEILRHLNARLLKEDNINEYKDIVKFNCKFIKMYEQAGMLSRILLAFKYVYDISSAWLLCIIMHFKIKYPYMFEVVIGFAVTALVLGWFELCFRIASGGRSIF